MKSVEKTQKLLTIKQVALSARKEIKQRRRESEKIHIPNDVVVEEIMMKLPVRSLMRFQTVSKEWRTLIRSRDFGERHMALQKSKGCKLLFVCDDFKERTEDTLFLTTVAVEKKSPSVVDEQALEFEFKGILEISESCDGLVCFYDQTRAVEVINPATTMFIELPLSRIQRLCTYNPSPEVELEPVQDPNPVLDPIMSDTKLGFGKDSVNGRYKLVWMYHTSPTTPPTCEVLDLEEKKWRFVNTTTLDHHNILFNQRPVFANGSLYWLTGDKDGYPTKNTKLIVFDMHTEIFQVIPTPPCITRDARGDKIGLCNLDGRLCISELKGDCKQEFWWRVEDNKWERIFSVDLHSTSTWFAGVTSQSLIPLTISRDTNKVILSLRYQDNLVALDLDPNSSVCHLYFSGYYGLVCPYFPTFT
ncbi:PREDICTED: putative F-box protein At2g02030 [Camelina sativa]|uniref:F-box protein At2g02030 n=1 Tax=Camelina sativa TaxID=90675 RepID=A0ABM0YWJ0_CAMSA|nr:PREDICTED: putative F-box protein At2g02030 [Camelina sativa]